MRFVIDGTTGLLGRNLLFEILKQNLKSLDEIEIIILGKGSNGKTLECRMKEIIIDDGFDYLNLNKNSDYYEQIKERIIYIDFDLTKPDLGISRKALEILKKEKIDYFFHIAALSSFLDTPEIINQLNLINIEGTKHLLSLVKEIKVENFIFVSSAYHAGSSQNVIYPDFVNNSNIFRNPYEITKLRAELFLKKYAKKVRINHKIFRITTISGRLVENELGSINKYDVFYGWGLYFLKLKMKLFKNSINIYSVPFEIKLRINVHPESTMNIIPADFGAKLLLKTCLNGNVDDAYHLVNETDIPTKIVINKILENLNITGHMFVEQEPEDKTPFEQFYYRTVGKIFTPYIIDPPLHYNNDNLKGVMNEYNLKCPEMNETNFQKLMDYAKKHNFGISI
ncbi:MAG: binding 4 protein [Ignavibacteria bacterium]|nr:binding 4 protein [Ignavibacteria bacterium]